MSRMICLFNEAAKPMVIRPVSIAAFSFYRNEKILTSLSGSSNTSIDDFLYIRLPFLKGIIESVFMIRYAMRLNMI